MPNIFIPRNGVNSMQKTIFAPIEGINTVMKHAYAPINGANSLVYAHYTASDIDHVEFSCITSVEEGGTATFTVGSNYARINQSNNDGKEGRLWAQPVVVTKDGMCWDLPIYLTSYDYDRQWNNGYWTSKFDNISIIYNFSFFDSHSSNYHYNYYCYSYWGPYAGIGMGNYPVPYSGSESLSPPKHTDRYANIYTSISFTKGSGSITFQVSSLTADGLNIPVTFVLN